MALVDAGGFSIEYDDVQKLISILQDQVAGLQSTLASVRRSLVTPPPANDAHSIRWANQAQSAVQTYEQWNQNRVDDLQKKITNLNATLANYKKSEQDNTIRP
ncbi:MAG TPA: hypothetical protein VF444_24875 [Pseudonocardiaceae bacterium]